MDLTTQAPPVTDPRMTRAQRKEHERRILRAFCDKFPDGRILEMPEPPKPDGLVDISGEQFAVELVQYRVQSPDNQRYNDNDRFLQDVFEALPGSRLQPHQLGFTYRSDSSGRATVPRTDDVPELMREMEGVVQDHGAPRVDQPLELWFSEDYQGEEIDEGPPQSRLLKLQGPPLLATHMSRANVWPASPQGLPGPFHPMSNLNTAFVGLDRECIRTIVCSKRKNLTRYRKASRYPIWLVIHSDGYPHSTVIPDLRLGDALECASENLARPGDTFDRAWWLNRGLGGDLGTLAEIPIIRDEP